MPLRPLALAIATVFAGSVAAATANEPPVVPDMQAFHEQMRDFEKNMKMHLALGEEFAGMPAGMADEEFSKQVAEDQSAAKNTCSGVLSVWRSWRAQQASLL